MPGETQQSIGGGWHHPRAVRQRAALLLRGLACVCSVDLPDQPGTVGWWAISGDMPTAYVSAALIPDPRAFLHAISRRCQDTIDAIERGNPPIELAGSNPNNWPTIISLLRFQADILAGWRRRWRWEEG